MSPNEDAGRSHGIKIDNSSFGRVQIFGNNLNQSNSIQEEIKSRLTSFGAESSVFQFAIQKFKD
jgi:hypothetical protein